jgi:hypothetical protein
MAVSMMSARSSLLAILGEVHCDERLYHLAAASTPGANELWQDVGMLYMRLMRGAVETSEVVEALTELENQCHGPLSLFGIVLERAWVPLENESRD